MSYPPEQPETSRETKQSFFAMGAIAGMFFSVMILVFAENISKEEPYAEVRKHMTEEDQEFLDLCLNKTLKIYNSDLCVELRDVVGKADCVLKNKKQ